VQLALRENGANQQGACRLGPWLRPSLDYVRVPRGDLQRAVVIEMLRCFETRLKAVASAAGNFMMRKILTV
jgi:hypothetical protein